MGFHGEKCRGRKTRRYKSKFTKPGPQEWFEALEFQAVIWVDEGTAVRILGEVTGTLIRDAYEKKLNIGYSVRNGQSQN